MSKVIELSDEHYRTIERVAVSRGQSPDDVLAQLIERLRDPRLEPHYRETEDWFRHLGATDEQITASARLARDEQDDTTDAHA